MSDFSLAAQWASYKKSREFNMLRNCFLLIALGLAACSSNQIISLLTPATPQTEIVIVQIPEDIVVTRINDRKFSGLLRGSAKQYHLNPGTHSIELRYEHFWELGVDDHHVVKSDIIKMEWDLAGGQTYQLKFNPANQYEASKKLANDFSPWLVAINTPNSTPGVATTMMPIATKKNIHLCTKQIRHLPTKAVENLVGTQQCTRS